MNPLSENKTLSATSLNGAIGACRLNIDAVDELMQLLEGCDWRTYIKMNLPDGKQVHLDGDQITVLRKAYFITLLQQYGPSDEDRDLLLAAAGLLAGYESIDSTETDKSSKITPRLTKYKEETQYAKSIGTLSKNERNKLDKFSNALYTKRQTGTINLWNDVLHYLGVEGFESIPENITLPTPSYLNRTLASQPDPASNQEPEQAESTGTVSEQEPEQTESTDTVSETEQETEQAETVSAKAAADQNTATPAPDPDSHSQSGTQPQPDPAPQPQPASIPNTVTENAVQQNAFLVRALGVVSIIAVACLAFVLIWQSLSQRAAYSSLSDTMTLPEIESISFAELDEPPTLAPGESVVLELEIEPKVYLPEDLDYNSDKVWAAYTNKNEVIANPELASTVDEVVAITAQKGPVEDTINVLVRGTDAAGSGGIGNGANGPDSSMEGGE